MDGPDRFCVRVHHPYKLFFVNFEKIKTLHFLSYEFLFLEPQESKLVPESHRLIFYSLLILFGCWPKNKSWKHFVLCQTTHNVTSSWCICCRFWFIRTNLHASFPELIVLPLYSGLSRAEQVSDKLSCTLVGQFGVLILFGYTHSA